MADQPRVTHFSITWDSPELELEPSSQEVEDDEVMNLSDLGEGGDEEDEEEDDSLSEDDSDDSDADMGDDSAPFNFS